VVDLAGRGDTAFASSGESGFTDRGKAAFAGITGYGLTGCILVQVDVTLLVAEDLNFISKMYLSY